MECDKIRVKCASCGRHVFICCFIRTCTECGGKEFSGVPWWYGRDIPRIIAGKKVEGGRKIIPKFYIQVHAFLHPVRGGDPFLSWLSAEEWFKRRGWNIVENEVWDSFVDDSYFIK